MSGPDIVFVLPYPAADHPSFPEGLLFRALGEAGFSVALLECPDWHDAAAFRAAGIPRLFFAIISGPLDSIVLSYTSSRKRRSEDLYQLAGNAWPPGAAQSVAARIRPDRTVLVYANRIREAVPGARIIAGGLEASLRRFSHYDFQQDAIRRSLLIDARLDLAVHGAGETTIVAIARLVAAGTPPAEIRLPGTAAVVPTVPAADETAFLPSCEAVQADASLLLDVFRIEEQARREGKSLAQEHAGRFVLSQPARTGTPQELDAAYGLPFSRRHFSFPGFSPALRMNLFSITAHRGCLGRCSFCSIARLEGPRIISRSPDSILAEIGSFRNHPEWKGIVADIGGASAEMYGMDAKTSACPGDGSAASRAKPGEAYRELLATARQLKDVRKIELGSGLRYDLLLENPQLLEDLLRFHAGRFLRVAPEHSEDEVLDLIGKPRFSRFAEFVRLFRSIAKKIPRPIELAPYLVIGLPGETDAGVRRMHDAFRALGLSTHDAQIFTPTPGTWATALWLSGRTLDGKTIPVERSISVLQERKRLLTGKT